MRSPRAIVRVVAMFCAVISVGACSGGTSAGSAASHSSVTSTQRAPVARATAAPVPSGGCTSGTAAAAGQTNEVLQVGGLDRTYVRYLPRSYRARTPVPLVFDFHGYGSNGAQQLGYGDFRPLAERDGFAIVALDGVGPGPTRHFVLGAGGAGDDVATVLALLDRLEVDLCVDTRRVYAAGMSDGGAMTSVLACRAAGRFAAFGPVAVLLHLPPCDPPRPVPIAGFMGTADPIVPFAGGTVRCCLNPTLPAAADSMAAWASTDRCATSSDENLSPHVVLRRWKRCAAGGEVRFYMVQGGGHTWPGAVDIPILGPTTHEISASDTLWEFFTAHPLPVP